MPILGMEHTHEKKSMQICIDEKLYTLTPEAWNHSDILTLLNKNPLLHEKQEPHTIRLIEQDTWERFVQPALKTGPTYTMPVNQNIEDIFLTIQAAEILEIPYLAKTAAQQAGMYLKNNFEQCITDESLYKQLALLNEDIRKEICSSVLSAMSPLEFMLKKEVRDCNQIQPISAITFNSDGTKLATGSENGVIKLWKYDNHELIGVLVHHRGAVKDIAFNHDDTLLISCGRNEHTIVLWDTATLAPRAVIPRAHKSHGATSARFSRDGILFASCSADKTIKLWNTQTRALVARLKGHKNEVTAVEFSPNNKLIASGSYDHTVKLWRNDPKASLLTTLRGHSSIVWSLQFNHDGTKLMSSELDAAIIWDTRNEVLEEKQKPSHLALVSSISSASEKWLNVKNNPTFTIKIINAPRESLIQVALNFENTLIAYYLDRKEERLLHIVFNDIPHKVTIRHKINGDRSLGVLFNPDNKTMISPVQGDIVIWRLEPPSLSLEKILFLHYLKTKKCSHQILEKMYDQCTEDEKKLLTQLVEEDR
jgi:hypothetical protein